MVAVVAPTHGMFTDGLTTLQKHAKNALPGNLLKIVDPVLLCEEKKNRDHIVVLMIFAHESEVTYS